MSPQIRSCFRRYGIFTQYAYSHVFRNYFLHSYLHQYRIFNKRISIGGLIYQYLPLTSKYEEVYLFRTRAEQLWDIIDNGWKSQLRGYHSLQMFLAGLIWYNLIYQVVSSSARWWREEFYFQGRRARLLGGRRDTVKRWSAEIIQIGREKYLNNEWVRDIVGRWLSQKNPVSDIRR